MNKFVPILLTALFVVALVPGVFADVATGAVGAGAQPGDQLPTICIKHRDVCIGTCANPPGVNPFDYRTGLYAFTGEQIEYTIVVRDPNGALDIGTVTANVDGYAEVLANPDNTFTTKDTCDGLGKFEPLTDKAFHVLLTVEPSWYGDKELTIAVENALNNAVVGTHTENWFFNPAISLSVTTSDEQPIHFEDGEPGEFVHSLNKLKVKNTAEGGVNMWMFIAGTDLFDPTGVAKCPQTNYLAIEGYCEDGTNHCDEKIGGMWYRGWSGTQWTSWEGWEKMSKYDQNDACEVTCNTEDMHCYGGKPVPYPYGNSMAPEPFESVLTNQGTLEVEFKLEYPVPCIGSFTEGTIYIFGKAI